MVTSHVIGTELPTILHFAFGVISHSFFQHFGHLAPPSKNELARSCKIVQESCMQDLLGTCTRYVPFLARFFHNLAKNVQTVIILAASLAKSCTIARYVQDCARIVQETGHIASTCQASLACKILAQSCMILQVRFCWARS